MDYNKTQESTKHNICNVQNAFQYYLACKEQEKKCVQIPKEKKKKRNMTQKLELSDRVFTAAKISILHEVKEKHP